MGDFQMSKGFSEGKLKTPQVKSFLTKLYKEDHTIDSCFRKPLLLKKLKSIDYFMCKGSPWEEKCPFRERTGKCAACGRETVDQHGATKSRRLSPRQELINRFIRESERCIRS